MFIIIITILLFIAGLAIGYFVGGITMISKEESEYERGYRDGNNQAVTDMMEKLKDC